MSVNAEPLVLHRDARGFVFEPVSPTELSAYRSIHVVVNEPGAVRGNHVHRRTGKCLIVEGSHAVQNTGARPRIIVVLGTQARDDHAPDVAADVLIAPQPR